MIAGKTYGSAADRHRQVQDLEETRLATEAAGAQIVTVAIRRTNIGRTRASRTLDVLPERFTILPTPPAAYTAEDAVRTCRLAVSCWTATPLTKLEVLGDQKTLYPDVMQTLKAAEQLVKDGFEVMAPTTRSLAKRRKRSAAAVMPLAAPIGSAWASRTSTTCCRSSKTPRCRSSLMPARYRFDAAIAMELGCDGVLMAGARSPVLMASAMRKAVEAGREALLAGASRAYASALLAGGWADRLMTNP